MFQKEYLAIVILPNTFPKLLRPKLLSILSHFWINQDNNTH